MRTSATATAVLKLLVAAIILWNTTYLQRAVDHLRTKGTIRHPVTVTLNLLRSRNCLKLRSG
jgi:hypothetical protein